MDLRRRSDTHIHVGLVQGLAVFGMVLLIGGIWRLVAMMNADNPFGQAMAFLY